jgi:alpha-ketoglutarate-dependent taurine dioxygenase
VDPRSIPTPLQTVDLTPCIGSEIKADRQILLSGLHAQQIRELLEKRGVLVVRDVPMSADEQNVFTQTLGQIDLQTSEAHLNISLNPALNRGAEYIRATIYWHVDRVTAPAPLSGIIMMPCRLSDVGGETEFANTYAAWEALSEKEKRAYEGLRVVHDLESSLLMVTPEPTLAQLEAWRREPAAERPLVWTHSSGRRSLIVGATASHVVGKSPEESRYILTKVRDWATQRRFVYQHRWRLGDVLIWDNTGTMHRVLPYSAESGRLLRRTALAGEERFA